MTTMPTRPYGKLGQRLSVIGFGGIVVSGAEQEHANHVVARAVERGVNYFDVAPTYSDAEQKLGPALEPFRKNVFLACKTTQRQAAGARAEFDASLERLRTDYFDLYQLHAITDVAKDVDAAFAAGGAMEFLTQAKRDGRVRHLGFSAHSVEAAMAALDRFPFDSVLVPVNFATFHAGFGPQIIAAACDRGASVLALKSMARQKWSSPDHPLKKRYAKCWYEPLTDSAEVLLALRFTLEQGVTSLLPPGEELLFELAIGLVPQLAAAPASDPAPLDDAQRERLRALAASLDPIFRAA
ncbi:MAG: aldo/keto reductase [Planctomycetota bacterium]|nr:aldo/keto reductase [Planctomycetota bacterium]